MKLKFDAWCEKHLDMNDAWDDLRTCFEMHEQQQQKIDELKKRLEGTLNGINFLYDKSSLACEDENYVMFEIDETTALLGKHNSISATRDIEK